MASAFDSVEIGLNEAISHTLGRSLKSHIDNRRAIDVKAIRLQVGMSQTKFAASFGISVATLRHWERGDRQPHGPARVLLQVVSKHPNLVLSALSARNPNQ